MALSAISRVPGKFYGQLSFSGDTLRDLRLYGLIGFDEYRDDIWSTTWAITDQVRSAYKLRKIPPIVTVPIIRQRPGYKFWIAAAVIIYLVAAYFL